MCPYKAETRVRPLYEREAPRAPTLYKVFQHTNVIEALRYF